MCSQDIGTSIYLTLSVPLVAKSQSSLPGLWVTCASAEAVLISHYATQLLTVWLLLRRLSGVSVLRVRGRLREVVVLLVRHRHAGQLHV